MVPTSWETEPDNGSVSFSVIAGHAPVCEFWRAGMNGTAVNDNAVQDAAFDESKVQKLPFTQMLKRIGPGLILCGVVLGPGAITTAAMLGAGYGYGLLWLLVPVVCMGITFMLATYRITLLTGMPTIHAIRHYYGRPAAIFVGLATFLACFFFTMGNISGTGAGMSLVFGINWKVGALIMIGILLYCYFSKGVYSKVELGITLCIAGMIVAFYITLVGTGGPDWSELAQGLTHWTFPAGSLLMSLGFISTHASVTTGVYGTYLGKEKKWKKEDMFNGVMMADAIAHVGGVTLIAGAIILVGAIVLHPTGQRITAPAQLAQMLVPTLGSAAKYIMGIALLGAGFSSLLGNTQRAVVLLNAGLDKPTSLEDKSIRWGSLGVILVAGIIAFLYNGSPIQLIYIANILTSISTPVAGFFICCMLCRKDVNAGLKQPRLLQACMIISYAFCVLLTGASLYNTVPKFLKSLAAFVA